jgi:hypothetical protein
LPCQHELIGSYVPPNTLHTVSFSFPVNFKGGSRLTSEYPDLIKQVMSLYTGLSKNDGWDRTTGTRTGTVNENSHKHWRKYRGLFKLHARGARWDVVYEAFAVMTTGAGTTVQVHIDELLFYQGKAESVAVDEDESRWDGFTKGRRTFMKFLE